MWITAIRKIIVKEHDTYTHTLKYIIIFISYRYSIVYHVLIKSIVSTKKFNNIQAWQTWNGSEPDKDETEKVSPAARGTTWGGQVKGCLSHVTQLILKFWNSILWTWQLLSIRKIPRCTYDFAWNDKVLSVVRDFPKNKGLCHQCPVNRNIHWFHADNSAGGGGKQNSTREVFFLEHVALELISESIY